MPFGLCQKNETINFQTQEVIQPKTVVRKDDNFSLKVSMPQTHKWYSF